MNIEQWTSGPLVRLSPRRHKFLRHDRKQFTQLRGGGGGGGGGSSNNKKDKGHFAIFPAEVSFFVLFCSLFEGIFLTESGKKHKKEQ